MSGAFPISNAKFQTHGIQSQIDTLISKSVSGSKEIAQVGTISANNDSTIGDIIAESMEKVGKDGVITIEEAKSAETSLEVVEGMQFDRGYLSPYFVTDSERMEVSLEDPYIILVEKKVSNMKDILPAIEQIAKTGNPFVIVAEDIEGEASISIYEPGLTMNISSYIVSGCIIFWKAKYSSTTFLLTSTLTLEEHKIGFISEENKKILFLL